jgi:hypothetical protein
MSYVRITEFTGRPRNQAAKEGAWFTVDGREGSVQVEHGDAALSPPNADAGHVATTWTGVRTYKCGSEQKGPIVYLLKYPVPFDYLYEFDAWFQYEHMPMLLEEPTWYGCELYRALGASCFTFAALHNLEPQALKSDARNRSVDTPWWHRLKQHEWFDKQFIRTLMKPL